MDHRASMETLAAHDECTLSPRRSFLKNSVALALMSFFHPGHVFGQTTSASAVNYTTTVPDWVATLKSDLLTMAEALECTVLPWSGPDLVATPEQFGYTVSSTPTQTTKCIQTSIDFVSAKGGGTVNLSNGDYVSGTIILKDNVRLSINNGARLIGSTNQSDYLRLVPITQTEMDTYYQQFYSIIYAERATNIAITGGGIIDGQGEKYPRKNNEFGTRFRPFGMRIIECNKIHVSKVTMINAASWMQLYLSCNNLLVENITVSNISNINNDGIDIDGCKSVIVRDCVINSEDDGICFKGSAGGLLQNVLVKNCQSYSSTNALKIGTDTQGSFNNILVYNCTFSGPKTDRTLLYKKLSLRYDPFDVKGGISWESTDGGSLSNILVSKCTINNALSPLFIGIGDRFRRMPAQEKPSVGSIRQIVFDQISGENNGPNGSWFSGFKDKPITDVVLTNINLGVKAYTGKVPNARDEIGTRYPDPGGNPVPAYGLWGRHITNLTLSNCNWKLTGTDPRPMIQIEAT
ncbi:Polygalacturonase [Candidatus Burkholderia brachyanthoides]|nr:Polygalacturonase [Candidatus Burkholderia brachyanthoides]